MDTGNAIQRNAAQAELMSLDRHKHLRFLPVRSYDFAAGWLYLPIHVDEAARLSQHFPVLFSCLDDGIPSMCMLKICHHKPVVTESGEWLGALPDVIKSYPFGWVSDGKNIRLTVYSDAPHFSAAGAKLFTTRGKPTQKLNQIIQALKPVQCAFAATEELMKELKELQILKPLTINFSQGQQQKSMTFWTAIQAPDGDKNVSNELQVLLNSHKESVVRHLKPMLAKAAEQSFTEPQPTAITTEKFDSSAVVNALISDVCNRCGVTEDELRSRKRSESVRQARRVLSKRAEEAQCLESLAIRLERRVATIKKWC